MPKNPFTTWTDADVAQHNARVSRVISDDQKAMKNATMTQLESRKAGVSVADSTDVARLNKTERAYYLHLQNVVLVNWIGVQNLTLKLADDCRYTPDFIVVRFSGAIEAHEVKGFWRDDAKVKIKVAARLFPWIRFIVVQKINGDWKQTPVKP
jgi:hypothetical protein